MEQEYLAMEKYAGMLNQSTAKEKHCKLLRENPTMITKAKVEDIASYLGITRRSLFVNIAQHGFSYCHYFVSSLCAAGRS